jgi:tellurite resistance protein
MNQSPAQAAQLNAANAGDAERLRHFPVPLFAVVMGIAGLALAWQRSESVLQLPGVVSRAFAVMAAAAFVVIAAGYAAKAIRYPAEVIKELRHPVRVNFFATISIGLVLLAGLAYELSPALATVLWTVAAVLHLGFTLYVVSAWIHRTGIEVAHVSPAWFIPVVGNVLLPITGVRLYPIDVSWFFFSIGLVFWLVLLTIVMYRLFFHAPLPERLTPTLFILVAPPAVSCVSYVTLSGGVDAFARILYYTAVFLTILLASNAMRFLRTPFFLSAWAYSFPLAAVTIASLMMTHRVGGIVFATLAGVLLAVSTMVVLALVWRTAVAVARHEICVEER